MCGIVGYVGCRKCLPILLNGLKNLEYRGYDSAGVAIMEGNCIEIRKKRGRVSSLENLIDTSYFSGTVGIAHTRWATHGMPCKENAHPHKDNSGTFSVVHNGIIENYKELRQFLEGYGYSFHSQTDTEVIPNLINYYYSKKERTKENFLHAVFNSCKDFKGSYAILVICKDFPEMQIVARRNSPLVIGIR